MKNKLKKIFSNISKGQKIKGGRVIKKGEPLAPSLTQMKLDKAGKRVVNALITIADKGKFFGAEKKYTTEYKNKKSSGKALGKGRAQASKKTKPDLKLSGEMLQSLTHLISVRGLEIGWFNKAQTEKVIGNKDQGRFLFHKDKIPKEVKKILDEEVDGIIETGLKMATFKVIVGK